MKKARQNNNNDKTSVDILKLCQEKGQNLKKVYEGITCSELGNVSKEIIELGFCMM